MATFIQSRKSFHFKNPNKGESEFKIPFKYVGEVPPWVTEQPYFKKAVESGDITYVGQHQESPKEEKGDTGAKKRGRPTAESK